MGNLQHIFDSADNQSTRQRRDADVMDTLRDKVEMITHATQTMTGTLHTIVSRADKQQSDDKKLRKDVRSLASAVDSHAKAVDKALGQVVSAVDKELKALTRKVDAIPGQIPKPKDVIIPDRADQFAAIERAVRDIIIPETDLSMIVDMLKMMANKMDEPMAAEISLPEPEKREFTITVTDRDFSGRVKEIKAEEV